MALSFLDQFGKRFYLDEKVQVSMVLELQESRFDGIYYKL